VNSTTIRRTVCVKLDLDASAIETLRETIDQYQWAANYVVEDAWSDSVEEPETVSRTDLHDRTYECVRRRTSLQASQVQLARNRAAEALKTVVEHRSQGRTAGKPRFTSEFLDFNDRSITIRTDHATLSSVDGRVHADFIIPENPDTPHHHYFCNEEFDPGRATLIPKNGDYFLHVTLTSEIQPEPPSRQWILGVDLGISNLAVTSTGRFWNGNRITHWRKEYQKHRRSLQQRGTRWAHQTIQHLSRRASNRVDQHLHTTANELLREACSHDCRIIAVEDLSYIYESIQRWKHYRAWCYRRLTNYLAYKGRPEGVKVDVVDPEGTSQECSTCGYRDPSNRTSQDQFKCRDCGYENHADYNAAKNIGLKRLRQSQNGSDGGAPAGVRVNSGLLTNSGYEDLPSHKDGPR